MSLRGKNRFKNNLLIRGVVPALALALAAAQPAAAQYVGQVGKGDKDTPELRSIAVLEWTGDEGKPTASRLVPVAVLDGGQLQDGGIYLARPEPLALIPEVEYELQQDGKPLGLFDIQHDGQELGSWVGFGSWKPMPSAHPKLTAAQLAKVDVDDDTQSDEPVLHRKHHADDAPAGGSGSGSGNGTGNGSSGAGSGSNSGSDSGSQAPSDPDRPVLHKAPSAGGTDSSAGNGPVLHKKDSDSGTASSDSGSQAPSDPDRPVLHNAKAAEPAADTAAADASSGDTDPDRPRLRRGKSSGVALEVAPSLLGLPLELQQTVAVSDAKTRPAHPWDYAWTNSDDEAKMKSAMEDMARAALGLNPPPAKPAPKRTATTTVRKPAKPAPPAPPAPLADEQFRVFELAYGSGATLVLSAHTDAPPAQQKYITLIAQPDLYGNVLLLKKSITDAAHLDEQPRMRLVDAVDAMADNRGELLFELRGATQRQFALYRVLRGQADQLFVTGGGQFGSETSER